MNRLSYTTTVGYLKGKMPNGEEVIVHHPEEGAKGYWLYWRGHWTKDIRRLRKYGFALENLGVIAREKHSGNQAGYTSQPAFMAIWEHLVDRHNAGHEDVLFSPSPFPHSLV